MSRGYKIFPRGNKFRDNWDETFGEKKDVATFENCVFIDRQLFGGCRAPGTKTKLGEIKGITE